jgi:hypothetical protein
MRKTILAFVAAALLLGTSVTPAHAFWHHWHQCCATPGYVYGYAAAPQAAPQEAPTAALLELVVPILRDVIRAKFGGSVQPGDGSGQPSGGVDLSGIKSDIAQIAASLENTNTTLRRHGEEIVNLRLQLTAIQTDVGAVKEAVGSTHGIQQQINTVLQKLPKGTRDELSKALTSNEFFTKVNAQTKLTKEEREAIIKGQTEEIQKILKRHYGE